MAESQFSMAFSPLNVRSGRITGDRGTIPPYFYPKAPLFLRHLLYRNKMNMTTIVLIVGQIRTGKSYSALKLAEEYSKLKKFKYDPKTQMSFKILPFLEWSATATDSVYILEEMGRSVPSIEWYSVQSKIFRNFLDTQGFRRNLLIMTLPNAKSLLSSVKTNVNYVIVQKAQGYSLIFKQIVDCVKGKLYYFYLGGLRTSLPSKSTVEYYESLKKQTNDDWLKADIKEMKRKEKGNVWIEEDPNEIFKDVKIKYSLKDL